MLMIYCIARALRRRSQFRPTRGRNADAFGNANRTARRLHHLLEPSVWASRLGVSPRARDV